ncbi:MAG TPA: type I-U CRISPR-associated RAMP protein Csb1/Cas7u [bacterium]|nr:type I-U CRISPR-associated RAMP protein Csb1/Cas7u [bacterium]
MTDPVQKYDYLLKDDGPAAIVLKQPLLSVEGSDVPIFPPTYAAPKGDPNSKPRYNIDGKEGNSLTCVIDSIGSQANRVEPIFKNDKYKHLVPQIVITHGGGSTNLLDIGHRVADAMIRFSELIVEIHNAFISHRDGDPIPMAKLAPTSLVFGAWDSRGTLHKIMRLINLRIDATNVEEFTRSAQYIPATDYVGNGLIEEVDESTGSDLGFAAVPAGGQLGGVRVHGQIIRSGSLNLTTIQSLYGNHQFPDLQRYILGLALVSITAFENTAFSLRQGCQLFNHPDHPRTLQTVSSSGKMEKFPITSEEALQYATTAAEKFGVGDNRNVAFDSPLANRVRSLWTDKSIREKLKELAKTKPLTMNELDDFEVKKSKKANKKNKSDAQDKEEPDK